jgi:pre-mRNA-processing factor 19
LGGSKGVVDVVSIPEEEIIHKLKAGPGIVIEGLWAAGRAILATSTGHVKVFEDDSEVASFSAHAGEATSIALHPSGEILASVGVDKSIVFYDLASSTVSTQVYTDSGKLYYTITFMYYLTIFSSQQGCFPP